MTYKEATNKALSLIDDKLAINYDSQDSSIRMKLTSGSISLEFVIYYRVQEIDYMSASYENPAECGFKFIPNEIDDEIIFYVNGVDTEIDYELLKESLTNKII